MKRSFPLAIRAYVHWVNAANKKQHALQLRMKFAGYFNLDYFYSIKWENSTFFSLNQKSVTSSMGIEGIGYSCGTKQMCTPTDPNEKVYCCYTDNCNSALGNALSSKLFVSLSVLIGTYLTVFWITYY